LQNTQDIICRRSDPMDLIYIWINIADGLRSVSGPQYHITVDSGWQIWNRGLTDHRSRINPAAISVVTVHRKCHC
jgi:hypothetical protein